MLNSKKIKISKKSGFSIVELIVVLVVISIITGITYVSYTSLLKSANVESMKSDLTDAAIEIKKYKSAHSEYPASVTDCPTPAAGNICLDLSEDNTYKYFVDNLTQNPTFELAGTNGDNTYVATEDYGPSKLTAGWLSVTIGYNHACGIYSNHKAYCWGSDNWLQLGSNGLGSTNLPRAVYTDGHLSGKDVLSIAASSLSTCVIASDYKAYCWGKGNEGDLGNGGNTSLSVPTPVDTSGVLAGKKIIAISGRSGGFCAITSENKVYCWGDNGFGALGANAGSDSLVPLPVDTSGALNGKNILSVYGGGIGSCVVASDNKAYCWGINLKGQLGNSSTSSSGVPVAVNDDTLLNGKKIVSMGKGDDITCAIDFDGKSYCWGSNSTGQIGDGTINPSTVPVAVGGILSNKAISSISAGRNHTCAVDYSNEVYCWGAGSEGQLGDGLGTQSLVPVAVSAGSMNGKKANSVFAFMHTCSATDDGTINCWGLNTSGELGNGAAYSQSLVPVTVNTPAI